MPDPRFQFHGDLASTPIAEVLQTVHRYRVPGVVSVLKDGVEKKVFIWNGDVIFASSGDREDSLGNYLLRMGRLTQQEFDRSVELLLESSGQKRHGDVLVDMGILTEQELYLLVKKQVKEITFSMFDWDEGSVTFSVGQYKTDELIKLEIPTRQMILEGVKSIEDSKVKRLVGIIGPSVTVFTPSFRDEDFEELELERPERRYLELVDGVRNFKELIALGPGNSFHNARLIYAYYVLRLISRKDPSKAIKKIQWKTSGGDYSGEP